MPCIFSHIVIPYSMFQKTVFARSSWKCRMFILKLNSDTFGTQLFHYTNFFRVQSDALVHREASKCFVKEDLLLLCHQKCTWRIEVKLSKMHICVKDTAAKNQSLLEAKKPETKISMHYSMHLAFKYMEKSFINNILYTEGNELSEIFKVKVTKALSLL